MLELFDGFISAVGTELKLDFKKESDGEYSTNIEFEGGRHQRVWIVLDTDESGDPMVSYYSVICKLENENPALYKEALNLNTTLTYGAIALFNEKSLIMHQATFLKDMDPQRFVKSLFYVAAKADELEEQFTGLDLA